MTCPGRHTCPKSPERYWKVLSTKAEIKPKLNLNSKPQGGAGTTPRYVYLNAGADGRKPTLATSQGQKAGNPYAAEARVRKYPLAHSPRGMTGGAGANPRHGGDGRRPTLTPPQPSPEGAARNPCGSQGSKVLAPHKHKQPSPRGRVRTATVSSDRRTTTAGRGPPRRMRAA